MRMKTADTDQVAMSADPISTAVFQSAQARYIGMETQDLNNPALRESEPADMAMQKPDGMRSTDNGATSAWSPSTHTVASDHASPITSPKPLRDVAGPPPSAPLPQLPAASQYSPFTSRPITLIVGGPESPSKETAPLVFYAHEHLLTSISPFFRAALQAPIPAFPSTSACTQHSGFLEATTGTITLPEERPEDIAYLLQWLYWRQHITTTLQQNSSPPTSPYSSDITSPLPPPSTTTKPSLPPHTSTSASHPSDLGLTHPFIDPPITHYKSHLTTRTLLKQTLGPSSPALRAFRKTHPRPAPPAFGPLVRLYLLADRYDVGGSLKWCICERVRWVGQEANCVLEKEDVRGLWEGLLVEGAGEGLKRVVLEMFAGLRGRAEGGLFGGGCGQIGEGDGWHAGFLRDLVAVLFEGLEVLGSSGRKDGGERGSLGLGGSLRRLRKGLEEIEEGERAVREEEGV